MGGRLPTAHEHTVERPLELPDCGGAADPLGGCVASREINRRSPAGLARDIDVDSVTGADGVSATVRYAPVGGCERGGPAAARFHLVDGSWRLSELGQ